MRNLSVWFVVMAGLGISAPAHAVPALLDFDVIDGGGAASSGILSPGQLSQYSTDFGVQLVNPNGALPLALFQSNCSGSNGTDGASGPQNISFNDGSPGCTGGDPDLATGQINPDSPLANQLLSPQPEGLILIVNERATGEPDDNVGGEIIFDFTDPGGVDFRSLVLIDLDEDSAVTNAITFEFRLAGSMTSVQLSGLDLADAGGISLFNSNVADNNSYRSYNFDSFNLANIDRLDVTFNNISGGIAILEYDRVNIPVPASLPLLLSALGLVGWLGWRRRRPA